MRARRSSSSAIRTTESSPSVLSVMRRAMSPFTEPPPWVASVMVTDVPGAGGDVPIFNVIRAPDSERSARCATSVWASNASVMLGSRVAREGDAASQASVFARRRAGKGSWRTHLVHVKGSIQPRPVAGVERFAERLQWSKPRAQLRGGLARDEQIPEAHRVLLGASGRPASRRVLPSFVGEIFE